MFLKKTIAVMLMISMLFAAVPALAEDLPTLESAPNSALVMNLLEAYAPDAYDTMRYTADEGNDMLLWWMPGETLLDGIGTAVHEQYHTFQSKAAESPDARAYYFGNNEIHQVVSTEVFPSDEIAPLIPPEYRTARFAYIETVIPDMGEDFIRMESGSVVDGKFVPSEGEASTVAEGASFPAEAEGSSVPDGESPRRMSADELLVLLQNEELKPFSITDGIYGLLAEYGAYATENKMSVALYDFYATLEQAPETWQQYIRGIAGTYGSQVELEYYILQYLLYAKEAHPDIYAGILANETFKTAFARIRESFQASRQAYLDNIQAIVDNMNALGYDARIEGNRLYMGETSVVFGMSEGIEAIAQELQKDEYQAMLALLTQA